VLSSVWSRLLTSLTVLQGIWAKLSKVAVKGAQYNSHERQPHPNVCTGLEVIEETNVEKRLAGTFFSRASTPNCHQSSPNSPSIRKDVSRTTRDNPALLDPHTPLRPDRGSVSPTPPETSTQIAWMPTFVVRYQCA